MPLRVHYTLNKSIFYHVLITKCAHTSNKKESTSCNYFKSSDYLHIQADSNGQTFQLDFNVLSHFLLIAKEKKVLRNFLANKLNKITIYQ